MFGVYNDLGALDLVIYDVSVLVGDWHEMAVLRDLIVGEVMRADNGLVDYQSSARVHDVDDDAGVLVNFFFFHTSLVLVVVANEDNVDEIASFLVHNRHELAFRLERLTIVVGVCVAVLMVMTVNVEATLAIGVGV